MNEVTKTLAYVGVSLAVLIAAWVTRPKPPRSDAAADAAKMLNAVDDPLTAAQLEIIEFNEETAKLRPFEVARVNGRWSIPSHQNYPADAQQQMGEAAVSVMNLGILGIASDRPGTHGTFGVIDPDINTLRAGTTGVGTRVTMKDAQGKTLVNMVVGKEVKDQQGQRYVREVGKDQVYIVKLDTSRLTTNFGDWIEKDLLKINTWDIRQVRLNDYSVGRRLTPQGLGLIQDLRSEITLAYDDGQSQWTVSELRVVDEDSQQTVAVPVPEDEELDQSKLNDLKAALDDLKIVDVERKPKGLSADLKADKGFTANRETVESLVERGFVPVQMDGVIEILSSEGEVVCTMKDGVEYLLRFGEIALGQGEQPGADGQAPSGINRYLFVTARFNPDVVEEPEYQELPELPVEKEEADQAASEGHEDGAAADSEAADENPAADEEPAADEKPAAEEDPAADEKPAAEEQPAADEKKAGDQRKQVEELRQVIEKENQRKRDEYEAKVAKAKDRVQELNGRFGDWYYVISDEVYRKIHLGRKDIFQAKAESESDDADDEDNVGADILKKLQQQGLPGVE